MHSREYANGVNGVVAGTQLKAFVWERSGRYRWSKLAVGSII